jgi:hypothetical protein
MPGNPEECRQHALACARLAQTCATREARDHYAKLARTCIKLAEDIEIGRAFLNGLLDETEQQTG